MIEAEPDLAQIIKYSHLDPFHIKGIQDFFKEVGHCLLPEKKVLEIYENVKNIWIEYAKLHKKSHISNEYFLIEVQRVAYNFLDVVKERDYDDLIEQAIYIPFRKESANSSIRGYFPIFNLKNKDFSGEFVNLSEEDREKFVEIFSLFTEYGIHNYLPE